MKVVAILQARLGSTRLPNKVCLPLAGKSMLQNIIERVQRAKRLDAIVVAFPNTRENIGEIGACALLCGIGAYAYLGDENDLVGRYLAAAQAFGADLIVRIPCDNPCVDPCYIDAAIKSYLAYPFVYYSNTTGIVESGDTVLAADGVGAEVVSVSRLKWLDGVTQGQPELREHPHRYFEQCGLLQLPTADLRLDVNDQRDYEFIKDIYDALYPTNPTFGIQDILAYLETKKVTA